MAIGLALEGIILYLSKYQRGKSLAFRLRNRMVVVGVTPIGWFSLRFPAMGRDLADE